ncbi:UNVERIFIED_CONTAM: hypothetical protein GTU68_049081 [Idotea baltica]|nr:hypothetical protein [Idotea baltica]
MIQGAGSNVGKSIIVAGLARAFIRRGLIVRPFKPQNMSNNAAVTSDGGEIGRAQALQARAANVSAHTDMNPVLLKPESDVGAQVIVQGKRFGTLKAREYAKAKPQLLAPALESFQRLVDQADLILIEGAGSPAEINLRAGDIANMGFAEAVGAPVVLIGDIDRGGVIAQLVGTDVILPQSDRSRITGFAVNKFRGDTSLFADGMTAVAEATGWAPLGIIPWFQDAWRLPAEDIMDIKSTAQKAGMKIAVPRLSRIANFDDLDPLSAEPGVSVEIIDQGRALPGDADLILIPGSKSTIADLSFFKAQGWDIDLRAHLRRKGRVLGICGGYQMLGQEISDPLGIEGSPSTVQGLGLLNVKTVMTEEKHLKLRQATHLSTGTKVEGYEIHIGETEGPDKIRAWLKLGDQLGCYLHGLFTSDAFRRAYLSDFGVTPSQTNYAKIVDETLDALADHLEEHLDLDAMLSLAKTPVYSRS